MNLFNKESGKNIVKCRKKMYNELVMIFAEVFNTKGEKE